jgi:hypothetical protein
MGVARSGADGGGWLAESGWEISHANSQGFLQIVDSDWSALHSGTTFLALESPVALTTSKLPAMV